MQEPDKKIIVNDMSRLRWACRRGMLELDVILGNFLNEAYLSLELDDKQRFVDLLSCTDPELFAWLLGHEVPTDPDTLKMVEIIRRHGKSRF